MKTTRNDQWLNLSKLIVKAHKTNGFESAIVFGKQGVGKTTYALKVAKEVYQQLGFEKDQAWQLALDSLFFELKDALGVMKIFRQNDRTIPLLIFDDAGIWLQKYKWHREDMQRFFEIYNIIRNIVSGLIFTTPSPNDIAFFIREKSWKLVKIIRDGSDHGIPQAMAKIAVNRITLQNGKIINKMTWEMLDTFTVRIPDNIYKQYIEKRKEYEEKLLEKLDELLRDDSPQNTLNQSSISLFKALKRT